MAALPRPVDTAAERDVAAATPLLATLRISSGVQACSEQNLIQVLHSDELLAAFVGAVTGLVVVPGDPIARTPVAVAVVATDPKRRQRVLVLVRAKAFLAPSSSEQTGLHEEAMAAYLTRHGAHSELRRTYRLIASPAIATAAYDRCCSVVLVREHLPRCLESIRSDGIGGAEAPSAELPPYANHKDLSPLGTKDVCFTFLSVSAFHARVVAGLVPSANGPLEAWMFFFAFQPRITSSAHAEELGVAGLLQDALRHEAVVAAWNRTAAMSKFISSPPSPP